MAALRRTTRQQRSYCELRQRRQRRRTKKCAFNRKVRTGSSFEEEKEATVEVIDLCSSGDEDEEVTRTTTSSPPEEEATKGEEFEEEEEDGDDAEFQSFVDFESEDSVANMTVKSFLRDCFMHPKILCHKRFQGLRGFIEETMGIRFELPPESPYEMDHEDDTFCVDKGDKWLPHLKERSQILKNKSVTKSGGSGEEDDDEEEEEIPPYFWANISPVQRKSDLGLIIFKWTSLPMTEPILDIYLTFCREKYVPPPPKPPSPPPLPRSRKKPKTRRRTRQSRRLHSDQVLEEVDEVEEVPVVEEMKKDEKKTQLEEVDNGVDDYIKEFASVFQLTRNMDVEDRLKGDVEAKARRKLEDKEEPKYSRELSSLLRRNHLMTTPVTLTSRKPRLTNGRHESETESSSSSSSSSSSASSKGSTCSVYKGRVRTPGVRGPYKTRTKSTTEITTPTKKRPPPPPVTNGLIIMSRTIRRGGSTNRSESSSSSVTVKKRNLKVTCDVCRPSKEFSSRKGFYKHLTRIHGSRKRELITCVCGTRVRKERLLFHERYCKKAIIGSRLGVAARGKN